MDSKTPEQIADELLAKSGIGTTGKTSSNKARDHETKRINNIFAPIDLPETPIVGDALLRAVDARLRQHIAADDTIFTAATLWVGFAWTHDAFVHSPILLVTSKEPNSGKTTLVELLKFLVPRGLSTTEITAAALYRVIDQWRPTLIVDEADVIFKQNDELRAVINSGWTRGSGVIRCSPETLEPEQFSTFGPKIIGMKGLRIPDMTLSRAIALHMKRKRRSEVVGDFMHDDDAELSRLHGQLARWGTDSVEDLKKARPSVPDGFHNRLACNWRPLFAVADLCGGEWPAKARAAARALSQEDAGSLYVQVLVAIKAMFDERAKDNSVTPEVAGRMFSQDMVAGLLAIEDGPWKFYGGRERDKPITQNGLARLLSPAAPQNITIDGVQRKGYERHQFEDDFARYLGDGEGTKDPSPPPTPQNNPSNRPQCDEIRISDDFNPSAAKSARTDAKCEKSNIHGLADGWTDEKEGGETDLRKNRSEPGLSQRDIERIALWCENCADTQRQGGCEVDQDELDTLLRRKLAEYVLPEHVELEFGRILQAVFKLR